MRIVWILLAIAFSLVTSGIVQTAASCQVYMHWMMAECLAHHSTIKPMKSKYRL
jgi:hypothetical protein